MLPNGSGNRLFDNLNEQEFSVFQPHLQAVTIKRGEVLSEAGQRATHVYFPVSAVLGFVGKAAGGATVVLALVAREGVASVAAAFGRQRVPFGVVAQVDGDAWRLPAEVMHREIRQCRELHDRLLLFSHDVIAQVGQSAICNRFHTAQQRLARWLAMTADRAQVNDLPLTHQFIAHMVGGPRSAITDAAAALRASGAIDYRRGLITIQNQTKLRQQSCECYDALQRQIAET
jgi:CRP-like cAMP-binding protein